MKYKKIVYYWLITGLVMLFFQVMIGGITRLTESGLSITKWEVVSGTLPPLNEKAWDEEFELYKETPQYKEINEGISMDDFKFIYFWEYIHRLWARLMGFVFIIPFIIFYVKGWLDKWLVGRLTVLVGLAALAAAFGWIMVASGLVERPWVNAYKLSVHLLLAFSVIAHLWWTILSVRYVKGYALSSLRARESIKPVFLYLFLSVLVFQIFLGGMMSGMKVAFVYPTWPDMQGVFLPDVLFDKANWKLENFVSYDSNIFLPALIHFLHRNTAYVVMGLGLFIVYRLIRTERLIKGFSQINYSRYRDAIFLGLSLLIQMLLGILTVLYSIGKVPITLGVLHQSGALIVFIITLYIIFAQTNFSDKEFRY
jgi:heme a synthase